MDAITIKSVLNSVSFGDPSGIPILGQSTFGHQIQRWQDDSSYVQKFQFSDAITLQFHIQDNGANPTLYLCDRYDPHTGNFHVVGSPADNILTGGTYDLNHVYGSGYGEYFKGAQLIAGNNYYNPFNGTTTPLRSVTWSFSFDNLGLATKGTYYLLLVNPTFTPTTNNMIWSEPMYFTNSLPYTILINSQYNSNKSGNINTYIAGWFTDTGGIPPYDAFFPTFNVRVEGYLIPDNPKGINIGYLQQAYDQQQIMALFKRMKKLSIGEISEGIPDYLLETVTSALLSDSFWIDKPNNSFILFNPSAQTSLTDIWKLKRNDAYALVQGSTTLMQRYDAQNAIVTPTPATPYSRIYNAVYDATYS